jgi:CO/xanthine dehydrogenase Mo-binding subunit
MASLMLIVADYEELPAVFDEVEAMTSEAVVHDELKPAGTFPDLKHLQGKRDTNLALAFRLRRGDCERAFEQAQQVFDHTFRTQQVVHLPLEPFVSVADAADESVTIHTASQSPSFVRIEIARLLGWPENRVRVKVPYLGGGFGAKLYIKLEALVTALSLLTRRPVKISLTMEEQFYTLTKHASTFRMRTAVKDTRMTAVRCEIWWNGGAYADSTSRTSRSTLTRSTRISYRPARCAGSASRSWCGPMRAMPTWSRARSASTRSSSDDEIFSVRGARTRPAPSCATSEQISC